MALKTHHRHQRKDINMKCRKCKSNLLGNSKCLMCGFEDYQIPEDVKNEVRNSVLKKKNLRPTKTPPYYFDKKHKDFGIEK